MGRKEISLRISMNWLIAVPLAAAALVVAYFFWPEHRPPMIFLTAVAAGTATLLAAINALEGRAANVEQSRKLAALEYIHRWNDPTFFHAKKNGREITREFARLNKAEEKKSYIEGDPNKFENLIDVLNVFESMSVAIQEGIVDEKTARRFFKSILLQYWHCAEEFIKTRRSERNNARIYLEMEWLFNTWKD